MEEKQRIINLAKFCAFMYAYEDKELEDKLKEQFDYSNFYFFSERSHNLIFKKNRLVGVFKLLISKFTVVNLQFFVGFKYDKEKKKEIITIVFKGSEEAEDWLTNLSMKKRNFGNIKNSVHKGFHDSFKKFVRLLKRSNFKFKEKKLSLLKDIEYINNNCEVLVCGHSLGGAIATLSACYLSDLGIKKDNLKCFTFGSPAIATKSFCDIYEKKVELLRVVNKNDLVPKLEKFSNLEHFGKEFILHNKLSGHGIKEYISNLESFSHKIKTPLLATDGIIKLYDENNNYKGIIFIKRKNPPYGLALPGGFVDIGEKVEDALKREMKEEVSLDVQITSLLGVYSNPKRDERFHCVSCVYICKAKGLPQACDDAKEVFIYKNEEIPKEKLVFDHEDIINDFLKAEKKI